MDRIEIRRESRECSTTMGARDDDDDDARSTSTRGRRRRRAVVARIFTHRVVVSSPTPPRRTTSRASATQSPQPYRPYLIAHSSIDRSQRTCASMAPATPRESAPLDTFSANSFKPARAATGLVDLRVSRTSRIGRRQSSVERGAQTSSSSPMVTRVGVGVGDPSTARVDADARATMRHRYRSNRCDGEKFSIVGRDARRLHRSVARARGSRDPIVRDRTIAREGRAIDRSTSSARRRDDRRRSETNRDDQRRTRREDDVPLGGLRRLEGANVTENGGLRDGRHGGRERARVTRDALASEWAIRAREGVYGES